MGAIGSGVPGEIHCGTGDIELNPGRAAVTLRVENTGDRPIQVGSHLHFAEANEALAFDRETAWGHRLGVPAGTAIRFEPGLAQQVELVPLAGERVVYGIRGLAGGSLDGKAPE
jgi:urease subunit beta